MAACEWRIITVFVIPTFPSQTALLDVVVTLLSSGCDTHGRHDEMSAAYKDALAAIDAEAVGVFKGALGNDRTRTTEEIS
jgi:hypothetical protein